MSTGLTPYGYIYPLGDDPIRNGDNVIRQLAEQLPRRLVMQSSPAAGQNFTPNATGGFRITFPTPFVSQPLLQVYCFSAAVYCRPIPVPSGAGGPDGLDGETAGMQAHRLDDGQPFTSTLAVSWVAIGEIRP